jgi:hypothetical protein
VSAPNVVPFVVTNRTGKRNRASRLPVIRPFLAALRHGFAFVCKDRF